MLRYKKIDRTMLLLSSLGACYFIALQEYERALAMVFVWLLSKGVLAVADVFYTFFTERPLFPANRGSNLKT